MRTVISYINDLLRLFTAAFGVWVLGQAAHMYPGSPLPNMPVTVALWIAIGMNLVILGTKSYVTGFKDSNDA